MLHVADKGTNVVDHAARYGDKHLCHNSFGYIMRDKDPAASLPVIGMETSLNKVMPANINRRLFDSSSAIDMVVSDSGTLKCFDQSIIMIKQRVFLRDETQKLKNMKLLLNLIQFNLLK